MSATSWAGLETFSSPASTSTASSGDDWMRSFLSSLALGISTSFIWPGSGGGSAASAGVSQYGNMRMARAGNSATTGGFNDGFLLLNQNHISLHHIGSTWTGMLGHSGMIDHNSVSSTPFTSHWVTRSGSFGASFLNLQVISFPGITYGAPPYIQIVSNTTNAIVNIAASTTTNFTSVSSGLRTGGPGPTLTWESCGTVAN